MLLVIIAVPFCHISNFIAFAETNMLANLLVFATGLGVIPPLEIDPSPSLQFDHTEDDDNHYMRVGCLLRTLVQIVCTSQSCQTMNCLKAYVAGDGGGGIVH